MIDRNTSLEALGAIVCQALTDAGIDSFLSGGAVVSIYSRNRYESYDLDFVSFGDRRKIKNVMESLGFHQDRSRLFRHPGSIYMVEFPGTAVQVGEGPIKEFEQRVVDGNTLRLLTPTDCIKDRLAAYIHWKDHQSLEQAVLVALDQSFDSARVETFCHQEGSLNAFEEFSRRVTEERSRPKK